jgi:rod shape-determining protein MreC
MQENARLREMVGFEETHPELQLVPAEVVARDINPYFRVTKIRIDAQSHRIRNHMPVVSSAGLVGQISEVDGRFAEVLLTVDPRSSIDVIVQRNRARGLLRGVGHENDYHGELSYLLRREEVHEGDIIVTSGMGDRFPPHLLVGRIESIQEQSYGLFQQVRVAPAVDFTRLEEVFVVTGRGGE